VTNLLKKATVTGDDDNNLGGLGRSHWRPAEVWGQIPKCFGDFFSFVKKI